MSLLPTIVKRISKNYHNEFWNSILPKRWASRLGSITIAKRGGFFYPYGEILASVRNQKKAQP
jgi:hypothetical protein